MLELVWQPWINNRFPSILIPTLHSLNSPYRTNNQWQPLYTMLDRKYGRCSSKECVLKKGTILYHGSLSKTFDFKMNENGKFFGLDYAISSWILTESFSLSVKRKVKPPYDWKGYIHVFKLKKPLAYEYIKGDGHPFGDYPECSNKPCIHAQSIIHHKFAGDNIHDLGTELSIPSNYNLQEYLEHVETHEIDIVKMFMFIDLGYKGIDDDYFSSWNPKNAIIKVHSITSQEPKTAQPNKSMTRPTSKKLSRS